MRGGGYSMAKKAPRIGQRLTHYDAVPAVSKRPARPEQWLTGQYGGKWEVPSKQERHWDVTAEEATHGLEKTKGRILVAILGVSETGLFSKVFAGAPSNPDKTLEWRETVTDRTPKLEKELEDIARDVKQFKADETARMQAIQRGGGKLSRTNSAFVRYAVKTYEQQRMVEWATNLTGWDYTRVHAVAFANAPVRQASRYKR